MGRALQEGPLLPEEACPRTDRPWAQGIALQTTQGVRPFIPSLTQQVSLISAGPSQVLGTWCWQKPTGPCSQRAGASGAAED